MKTQTKIAVLAVGLFALVAVAAAVIIPQPQRIWFQNGFLAGSSTAPASVQNVITDTRGTYFAYQFGTITAPVWQQGGTVNGPTIAKAGVRVGDVCMVASDRSIWDGGRPADVSFDCQVPATGYILLRASSLPSDAGIAVTVPDAGYYFRTFSFTAN